MYRVFRDFIKVVIKSFKLKDESIVKPSKYIFDPQMYKVFKYATLSFVCNGVKEVETKVFMKKFEAIYEEDKEEGKEDDLV